MSGSMRLEHGIAGGMDDWDQLRVLLAVAREGSFTAAARRLRLDATTVGRRVTRLEVALGAPLFVRNGPQLRPTSAGRRIADLAEEMERTQQAVRNVAADLTGQPAGRVRLTTLQDVADQLLVPVLVDLALRHPGLRIDLLTTPETLDLAAGRADVAVRVGRPAERHLVARHLTTLSEAPHVAPSWLAARGLAASDVVDLRDREVLLLFADEDWTAGLGRARPRLRAGNVATLVAAARGGMGIVMCPAEMADGLVPLPALPIRRDRSLWLATTPELSQVPRVRVVMDTIVAAIGQRRPAGDTGPHALPPHDVPGS